MKHLFSIIALSVLALLSLALFLYQSGNGKLTGVLGKPSLKEGASLIKLNRKEITTLKISSKEHTETYHKFTSSKNEATEKDFGWTRDNGAVSQRADYRKIEKLLFLIESATVINELKDVSLEDHYTFTIHTTTEGGADRELKPVTLHSPLPRFTGVEPLLPVFAVTLEGRTYACTSELEEAFPVPTPNNLIDRRPFYFHPSYLRELTYRSSKAEVTLTHNAEKKTWGITAPIQLRSAPKKVKALIHRLYTLEAAQIKTVNEKPAEFTDSITLKSYVSTLADQTLFLDKEGSAAYNSDSQLLYTFGSSHDLKKVLPAIDDLRATNLSTIEVKDISSILLQSKAQTYPVSLKIKTSAYGSPRWVYQTSSQWLPADEVNVTALITALTKDQVKGFSLENLSSNQEPDKSITVLLKNNEKVHFNLFRKGEDYLIQVGNLTQSAILSSTHYHKIKTRPEDWQVKKLWDFSPIHLRGFQRQIKGRPIENYSYNFNLEEWKGQIGAIRVDEEFDNVAATSYLDFLESLHVEKWLSLSDPILQSIPTTPVLSLITLSEEFSNFGDSLGITTRSLTVLPKKATHGTFLIKVEVNNTPPQYGLLKEDVARALGQSLIYID